MLEALGGMGGSTDGLMIRSPEAPTCYNAMTVPQCRR